MEFKDRIKIDNKRNDSYYRVYGRDGNYLYDIDVENEKNLTNEFLYGVTCFVVNEHNQILMEGRADTELTPRKKDLISGHVNGSEIGIQAVIRELSEEVGIENVTANDIQKVCKYAKSLGFESKGTIRNFFIDFYCYKTKQDRFTIQPEEVKSLKWVPMEEAFEMIKLGKTKFPKQEGYVNYDEIFENVRNFCMDRTIQEKKVIDK